MWESLSGRVHAGECSAGKRNAGAVEFGASIAIVIST